MKKRLANMALLLAAAAVLSACEQEQEPAAGVLEPHVEKIASQAEYRAKTLGNRTFAMNLFRLAAAAADGQNVVLSPYSANTALNMVWNGAQGATMAEMGEVLCNGPYGREQINIYSQALTRALATADPSVDVRIANSLWADRTTPFHEAYVEMNRTWYGAETRTVDFNDSETGRLIDAWCREHTRGKIDGMSDGIKPDTKFAVVSALYFSAEWRKKFDSTRTVVEPFTNADGSRTDVRMMRQAGKMYYAEDAGWKMVELPYGNGTFSMIVWMPADDAPIADRLARWSAEDFYGLREAMTEHNVKLKLPAFETECMLELHEAILPRMGMVRVFDPYLAELYDMGRSPGRLFVDAVLQKTFIRVDETGTEATAATVGFVEYTSAAERSAEFVADRPFGYAILENHTGTILFFGLTNRL